MTNKIAKERVIYDNYNPWDTYPDSTLKEMALECGWVESEDEITENDLITWRYNEMDVDWSNEEIELRSFFNDKIVEFVGTVAVWNGTYKARERGEFWKLLDKAMIDCDYFKIYDENGHMYLTCSHHDGTHHFEIKVVTDKGYTVLPRYAEKVWGCKAREYIEPTKVDLINKLANEARSNYA